MTAETHIPASHEALPFHQDPTFWVAIAIVLFVVLAFKSLRRIFLQKTGDYADNVAKQLNEAKALRIEAENLITQYRQRQKEAVRKPNASLKPQSKTRAPCKKTPSPIYKPLYA